MIEIIVLHAVFAVWAIWVITCQEQPKQEQPKQDQPKQGLSKQGLSDYEIDLPGIESRFFFLRSRCDNEIALHQLELEYKKAMRELIRRYTAD